MPKAYLEVDDVKRLENTATCLRDRLLVRLLFHLGCRISEALSIKVDDVDFEQGTVTIRHLKAHVELHCPECGARLGQSHKFCPTCGHSVDKAETEEKEHRRLRTLPVDDDTLELLADFVRRDKTKGLIFGINRHRAWQIIRDCAERAQLPKLINPETGKVHNVSPHKLRDAFAVHAVKLDDSGDGLRLLQEHLGHASFNTTAKYRKVAGEEHRQWYQRLWSERKNGDATSKA
jgi:integrase/recombinase XerD